MQVSHPLPFTPVSYSNDTDIKIGGYLSVQLSLNYPDAIKACISELPCIDLKSAAFTAQHANPRAPPSLVREYLANKEDKISILSSDITITRFLFAFSMMDSSMFLEFFGTDEKLFPSTGCLAGRRSRRCLSFTGWMMISSRFREVGIS